MGEFKKTENDADGVDRRGFLRCMTWAGSGVVWTLAAGVPTSSLLGQTGGSKGKGFHFVQISDSHIGFNKAANQDVTGTLKLALDKITRKRSHIQRDERILLLHDTTLRAGCVVGASHVSAPDSM